MKDIKANVDPVMLDVGKGEGYDFFENPGIQPRGAQEPAGENERNVQKPEKTEGGGYPAKGSGY
ncbi:MAG: hypothetical protein HC840_01195 [Leptolyngbyaceae cyanobacterium RM2_2_4]|nr:hypothetical protein [Leptolyngbyaceae cyanobacterium RM2_2_4]